MEKTRIADLSGVLGELDIGPGDDIAEGPLLKRPSGAPSQLQILLGQLLERVPPLEMQRAQPVDDGAGVARPGDPFPGKRGVPERMVEDHGPPELDVPCHPGDARRAEVIPFVAGPVGVPSAVRVLVNVQTPASRPPETFLRGQAVEMDGGQLPGHVELPDQGATQIIGHTQNLGRGEGAGTSPGSRQGRYRLAGITGRILSRYPNQMSDNPISSVT